MIIEIMYIIYIPFFSNFRGLFSKKPFLNIFFWFLVMIAFERCDLHNRSKHRWSRLSVPKKGAKPLKGPQHGTNKLRAYLVWFIGVYKGRGRSSTTPWILVVKGFFAIEPQCKIHNLQNLKGHRNFHQRCTNDSLRGITWWFTMSPCNFELVMVGRSRDGSRFMPCFFTLGSGIVSESKLLGWLGTMRCTSKQVTVRYSMLRVCCREDKHADRHKIFYWDDYFKIAGSTSLRPLLLFVSHLQGSLNYPFGGDQTMQFFERFPLYNSALFVLWI